MRKFLLLLVLFLPACATVTSEPLSPMALEVDKPAKEGVTGQGFEKAVVRFQGHNGKYYPVDISERLYADLTNLPGVRSIELMEFVGTCPAEEPNVFTSYANCKVAYKVKLNDVTYTGGIHQRVTHSLIGAEDSPMFGNLRHHQAASRTIGQIKKVCRALVADIELQVLTADIAER